MVDFCPAPGHADRAVGVVLVGGVEQAGLVADPVGQQVDLHLKPRLLDGLLDRQEPLDVVVGVGPVVALPLGGQGREGSALSQQTQQVAATATVIQRDDFAVGLT